MPCEKSRIIIARSPPARILEILSFSKFNREDNFFADNQIHICGRYGKRNRGYGRILHAIRLTGATGKTQLLERNAAAYLIRLSERKRDRLCKSCRRSSFRSHAAEGRKSNILRCPRCRTSKSGLPSGVLRREEQNRARRKSRGGENARKS